jgi:broad specificity phosphatase PhoE
MIIRHCEKP